jgi:hypothetical protein
MSVLIDPADVFHQSCKVAQSLIPFDDRQDQLAFDPKLVDFRDQTLASSGALSAQRFDRRV